MALLVRQFLGIVAIILISLGITTLSPVQNKIDTSISYEKESPSASTTPTTETKKGTLKVTTEEKKEKPAATSTPTKKTVPETPKIEIPPVEILPKIETNLSELNTEVRKSIVNILCTTKGNPLRAISGTGVIIDSRGVILTNAHIGQYYLLKEYAGPDSVTCAIRTGSPARLAYQSELLFISPLWIGDNRNNIKEENPLGTGENDFALVAITKKIDGSPIQESFIALDIDTEDNDIDREQIISHVVAGYPAGFLGGAEIERELYMASAIATIREVFTFKETTIDLIALGGNIVAQKGASGGAIVSSKNKKLVGLIVTTTDAETTGERDLRAITLAHIERSMREQSGSGIREYLKGNLNETAATFERTIFPTLTQILKNVLTNQ